MGSFVAWHSMQDAASDASLWPPWQPEQEPLRLDRPCLTSIFVWHSSHSRIVSAIGLCGSWQVSQGTEVCMDSPASPSVSKGPWQRVQSHRPNTFGCELKMWHA